MLNSAVINGKVSLACDISPASPDDSVALILWYKDDSLAPIYTIDARKGKLSSHLPRICSFSFEFCPNLPQNLEPKFGGQVGPRGGRCCAQVRVPEIEWAA